MPRLHLTDLAVRALKTPASGQVDYWDAAIRGFGVRVSQAGTKTFVAKVKNRRVTIGRYPDVSLADARRKANGVKSETQPVDRSNITFEQAYEKFKAAHRREERAYQVRLRARPRKVLYVSIREKPAGQDHVPGV